MCATYRVCADAQELHNQFLTVYKKWGVDTKCGPKTHAVNKWSGRKMSVARFQVVNTRSGTDQKAKKNSPRNVKTMTSIEKGNVLN